MSASIWTPDGDSINVNADSTNLSEVFSLDTDQTLVTLTAFTYTPGTESIAVYLNGQRLIRDTDWEEDTGSTIYLLRTVYKGDVLEVVAILGSTSEYAALAEAAADRAEAAASSATNWPIVEYVQFAGGTGDQGILEWNPSEETLDLIQNGSVLQLGQEVQYHCLNNTGSTIPNGTVVCAAGTTGVSGNILIEPYIADGTIQPKYVLGITTYDIANGAYGKVTSFGKVRGLNTTAWSDGDVLYASDSVAGALTDVRPEWPSYRIPIAFVLRSHAINGSLMVRVDARDELIGGTDPGDAVVLDDTGALPAVSGKNLTELPGPVRTQATATLASDAFKDFTISDTFQRIVVTLEDVVLSDGGDILIQIKTSGGAITTGYVCHSAVLTDAPVISMSDNPYGFVIKHSNAAATTRGKYVIERTDIGEALCGTYQGTRTGTASVNLVIGAGQKADPGVTITGIRIKHGDTGTMVSGTLGVLSED